MSASGYLESGCDARQRPEDDPADRRACQEAECRTQNKCRETFAGHQREDDRRHSCPNGKRDNPRPHHIGAQRLPA